MPEFVCCKECGGRVYCGAATWEDVPAWRREHWRQVHSKPSQHGITVESVEESLAEMEEQGLVKRIPLKSLEPPEGWDDEKAYGIYLEDGARGD